MTSRRQDSEFRIPARFLIAARFLPALLGLLLLAPGAGSAVLDGTVPGSSLTADEARAEWPLAAHPSETGEGIQVNISPDGREKAIVHARPATPEEMQDLSLCPDGWIQEEPRLSYRRDGVPLPLIPDWTGDRNRAAGAVIWADIDHDGDLDLFVGTYYANSYPPIPDYYNFAYLNDDGALEATPGWTSLDQKHTTDLFWARIDADEYPDLFVANGGFSLQPSQVFYGLDGMLPASAGWSSADNAWAIGCDLADFDQDGDLDAATANQGSGGSDPYRPVYLFRNNGNGLEMTPSWQSAQIGITNDAAWADMDGDTYVDLAVSGWVNWQTGVFRNLGTTLETGFAWTTGHPERTDKGIGWSDVDGMNGPDLLVGGNSDPDWLFLNTGSGLGVAPDWESQESYNGCQDLAWVDIDRDGDEDLATVHFSTGHVRIYLNNGGTLSTVADWQYDASSSGTAIAFGDLNGDDWPDLAMGVANGPVMVFLNQGDPTAVEDEGGIVPNGDSLAENGSRAARSISVACAPNPAAGALRIHLQSAAPFTVRELEIVDAAGRRVASPMASSGASLAGSAGVARLHGILWDPAADGASPGVYFVRASGLDARGHRLQGSGRVVVLGE